MLTVDVNLCQFPDLSKLALHTTGVEGNAEKRSRSDDAPVPCLKSKSCKELKFFSPLTRSQVKHYVETGKVVYDAFNRNGALLNISSKNIYQV